MDLVKAKIYIDKIQRELTRMAKDPENVPRIDTDITLSYIRELYDAILSEAVTPAPAPARKAHAPTPPPAPVAPPPVAPPPPPVVEVPVIVSPPPPPPVVVVAPPVVEVPVAPPPPVIQAPPPPPPVIQAPPPVAVPADVDVLFEYREAKELSEKLSDSPIADLKKALSLNDRMLLTRELFNGDTPTFNEALDAINNMSGFEQAKSYLVQHCIGRYDWTAKAKLEPAKNFIKLVRRRFK
jgi:hypothetical protein